MAIANTTSISLAENESDQKHRTLWSDAIYRFRKNWLAVGGGIIILVFVLAALIGPYLAPYDFLAQDIIAALQGPSAEHWLGTDELGRDIFSRLLYGARTAAVVALTTTAVSLFIGIVVGALGRLLLPGKQKIGILVTILVGIVSALIGTAVAGAIGIPTATSGVDWLELLVQVVVAALGVGLVAALMGRGRSKVSR